MSSQVLHFRLEEPGDDPLSDNFFHILSEALQPGSESSMAAAVKQITALLPDGKPYSIEMANFLSTSYEIAEQIDNHDYMNKLVTIIDLCHRSPRFPEGIASNDVQTDPSMRFEKLGETCRDFWNTTYVHEDAVKYVNFQAFVARLYQRGLLTGYDLAIWVIEDALDREAKSTDRDTYTKAAANYLILGSPGIYEAAGGKKWRHWRKKLAIVQASPEGSDVYSQHTVELVSEAIVAMDAVKQHKTGCVIS